MKIGTIFYNLWSCAWIIPTAILLMGFPACKKDSGGSSSSGTGSTETYYIRQLGQTTLSAQETSGNDLARNCLLDSERVLHCLLLTTGNFAESNGGSNTQDVALVRLDSSGNVLWRLQIGSVTGAAMGLDASGEENPIKMVMDQSGNYYITGLTNGSFAETHGGNWDIFMIKVSQAGALLWATQFGNDHATSNPHIMNTGSADQVRDIKLSQDESYLYFSGFTLSSLGETRTGYDVILGRVSSTDGSLNFLTHLGNTTAPANGLDNSDTDQAEAMVLDSSDNVYLVGSTKGDFLETNGGNSFNDIFILKFDSLGNYVAGRQYGTVTHTGDVSGDDIAGNVLIDSNQKLFVGFSTTGNFIETNDGGSTNYNLGLMRLPLDLSSHDWIRHYGVTSIGSGKTTEHDLVKGIALSATGSIILTGQTNSDLSETNGNGIVRNHDVFVADVSQTDGTPNWITQFGLETSSELTTDSTYADLIERDPVVDSDGNIYLSGHTQGNFNEPNGDQTFSSYDILYLKLNSQGRVQ